MGPVLLQSQRLSGAERVSAISDGEALDSLDAFLAELNDADRAAWLMFHLTRDALRSDELAEAAPASAAFINRISSWLADEPPLPAPAVLPARRARRLRQGAGLLCVAAVAALSWFLVLPLQLADPAADLAAGLDTRLEAVKYDSAERRRDEQWRSQRWYDRRRRDQQWHDQQWHDQRWRDQRWDDQRRRGEMQRSDMQRHVTLADLSGTLWADGRQELHIIHNMRLNQYLEAHRQFTLHPALEGAPVYLHSDNEGRPID